MGRGLKGKRCKELLERENPNKFVRLKRTEMRANPQILGSDSRVIMDKTYEEISSSLAGRFTNAYRPMVIHIGKALNVVVKNMIGDLENTLVKESGK